MIQKLELKKKLHKSGFKFDKEADLSQFIQPNLILQSNLHKLITEY
jgi:hypothetical protein